MRELFYIYKADGLVIYDNAKFGKQIGPGKETNMGGVVLPMEIFDELVVMRYAQLTTEEIAAAEKRAIDKYTGNAGCSELSKKHGLPGFMDLVNQEIKDIKKAKE
jgi:hypothetical protein